MNYSSQKSWVEIWLGLVEIGGMLILRGAEDPLLGGVGYMWPAMPIFELGRGYLVQIGWGFQELSIGKTKWHADKNGDADAYANEDKKF